MQVNFVDELTPLTGIIIKTVDLDIIPDLEDRVRIDSDFYIVNDRIFDIGKKNSVSIYLERISKKEK